MKEGTLAHCPRRALAARELMARRLTVGRAQLGAGARGPPEAVAAGPFSLIPSRPRPSCSARPKPPDRLPVGFLCTGCFRPDAGTQCRRVRIWRGGPFPSSVSCTRPSGSTTRRDPLLAEGSAGVSEQHLGRPGPTTWYGMMPALCFATHLGSYPRAGRAWSARGWRARGDRHLAGSPGRLRRQSWRADRCWIAAARAVGATSL
jgi:hypothetical protein